MDKLTSILAVAQSADAGTVVLDKAFHLARVFGARVEIVAAEPLPGLLLRRITECQPDLVIKAPAGAHPLRAWTIDATDRELVARCPVPVLMARNKTWRTPIRMAAAVDVSDPEAAMVARGVLQSAGFLALGLQGNVDILYTEREKRDETVRMERAVKLSRLVREYYVGCERLQMFDGPPDRRLPAIVGPRQYDLLVLGGITHRTDRPLRETLTSKLFEAIDGDVLLVKPGMRDCARERTAADSPRQQMPHHAEEFV
jgi:hypothetical protein